MLVKVHKNTEGQILLAICDDDLIGKKFEEGNLQLDLSSDFYKGEEKSEDEIMDLAFYPKNLDKTSIMFMPLTVYEILRGGFAYLSNITGLKELAQAMSDPEIETTITKNHPG